MSNVQTLDGVTPLQPVTVKLHVEKFEYLTKELSRKGILNIVFQNGRYTVTANGAVMKNMAVGDGNFLPERVPVANSADIVYTAKSAAMLTFDGRSYFTLPQDPSSNGSNEITAETDARMKSVVLSSAVSRTIQGVVKGVLARGGPGPNISLSGPGAIKAFICTAAAGRLIAKFRAAGLGIYTDINPLQIAPPASSERQEGVPLLMSDEEENVLPDYETVLAVVALPESNHTEIVRVRLPDGKGEVKEPTQITTVDLHVPTVRRLALENVLESSMKELIDAHGNKQSANAIFNATVKGLLDNGLAPNFFASLIGNRSLADNRDVIKAELDNMTIEQYLAVMDEAHSVRFPLPLKFAVPMITSSYGVVGVTGMEPPITMYRAPTVTNETGKTGYKCNYDRVTSMYFDVEAMHHGLVAVPGASACSIQLMRYAKDGKTFRNVARVASGLARANPNTLLSADAIANAMQNSNVLLRSKVSPVRIDDVINFTGWVLIDADKTSGSLVESGLFGMQPSNVLAAVGPRFQNAHFCGLPNVVRSLKGNETPGKVLSGRPNGTVAAFCAPAQHEVALCTVAAAILAQIGLSR